MIGRGDPRGYYALLELPLNATPDEIRRAFGARAKELHPDHAGPGGDAQAFQRVVDAYEVLGDPLRRLRYDAESVEMSRGVVAPSTGRPPADPLANAWSVRQFWLRLTALVPQTNIPNVLLLAAVAGLALLLAGTTVWGLRQHVRLAEQDERLAALTAVGKTQGAGSTPAPGRANTATMQPIYATDLSFPPRSSELGRDMDGRLGLAIDALARTVTRPATDGSWLIVLQVGQDPALSVSDLTVSVLELSLSRLRTVADRLVRYGLPPDHLAMRFLLGDTVDLPNPPPADSVVLQVLCCRQMTGRPRGGG